MSAISYSCLLSELVIVTSKALIKIWLLVSYMPFWHTQQQTLIIRQKLRESNTLSLQETAGPVTRARWNPCLAEDLPLQQVHPPTQQGHGLPQDVTVEGQGFLWRPL